MKKIITISILIIGAVVLATQFNYSMQENSIQESLPPSTLDFKKLIPEKYDTAWKFKLDDWIVWGADMVQTDDGVCHSVFSHWPIETGFLAWVTHSRIGYATADNPKGPYHYQGSILPVREGAWDFVTHNPSIIEYEGKYYLYYTGTHGAGEWKCNEKLKNRRERWKYRMNMRVGVAVADHPSGPWKRFDKPLLDVGEFGESIIATPCAMVTPEERVHLYYKTQIPGEGKFGGGIMHFVATSNNPLGPFKRYEKPMIDKREYFPNDKFTFHIDDHEEWYQGDRHYAVVKDHDKPYLTPYGRILHLMESVNGLDWTRSQHSYVADLTIDWTDGTINDYRRLEMPKIFLEKGKPRILFLAALERGDTTGHAYNIAIPLNELNEEK